MLSHHHYFKVTGQCNARRWWIAAAQCTRDAGGHTPLQCGSAVSSTDACNTMTIDEQLNTHAVSTLSVPAGSQPQLHQVLGGLQSPLGRQQQGSSAA